MTDDDGVELLDLGTVNDPERPAARRLPRRRFFLLGGVAAAGGVAALAARDASRPKPRPAPLEQNQISVTRLRGPLLGGPRVDVFGFNQRELVRVELATGRVTRTGLAGLEYAAADVVPVRGGVLVHRGDDGAGWFVRDVGTATPVPPGLQAPGPLLPGPDLDHVWVMSGRSPNSPLRLVDLDGRTVRSGVGISARLASYPVPDGGGYPLFFGVGGTYWAGPRGARRVTLGSVVAGGPTGWLVLECDEGANCAAAFVDRSGRRRAVPIGVDVAGAPALVGGSLSPDGAHAALFLGDPTRAMRLVLADLRTAAQVSTGIALAPGGAVRSPRWSADGRLVFSVDDAGRIVAVDAATGRTAPLIPTTAAPPVEDVAVRG